MFTLSDLGLSTEQAVNPETPQVDPIIIPEDIIDDSPIEEKEEEETEVPANPIETPPTDKTPSLENKDELSVFAKAFREEGALSSLSDDELKEIKTLNDAVKFVKEEAKKEAFKDLTPTQQRYLETINAGVAPSEFEEIQRELDSLNDYTPEALKTNNQGQFTVIALDLIDKGVPEETAVLTANAIMKNPEISLTKALEATESLKASKTEKFNALLETKKQENITSVEKSREFVESKEKLFDKLALSKSDKDKIFSKMTTRVDLIDGQQVNEFAKWRKEKGLEAEFILNAVMHLTNNFTSLGKLGTITKTGVLKELEDKLRSSDDKDTEKYALESGAFKFDF